MTFERREVRVAWQNFHSRRDTTPTVTEARGCDQQATRDVILVSCAKQKLDRPAPAKDLYVSALFRKARAYAETTGLAWFVLSAEHGLVSPDQVLEPYELRLSDTSAAYRRDWGTRVVRQLAEALGDLANSSIEVHAGAAYIDPLRDLLVHAGADITEPLNGLRQGERLAWYGNALQADPDVLLDLHDVARYIEALRDDSTALTPAQFVQAGRDGLQQPGLYSWWVDTTGAEDLTRGLLHELQPGLIYAGLAGATRERSGKRSSNTLLLRITRMHLGGRHQFSTLRRTLGSVLGASFAWDAIDEEALTAWMHAHLRVVALPVADADTLAQLETAVLCELDPPLNLRQVPRTDLRRGLSVLRRQFGGSESCTRNDSGAVEAQGPSKAETFASFARTHGWGVEVRRLSHRDYGYDQRHRLDGWAVIARRANEVVTCTWIDEVAIGPIGWYSAPSAQYSLSNLSSARRVVERETADRQ